MARLVVVSHEFDLFATRTPDGRFSSEYLLFGVIEHLAAMGHDCVVTKGPEQIDGDAALLHVNGTFVADEYLALATRYPRTINFGTGDISKWKVSRNLLNRGDEWGGKVVIKANRNCDARGERIHNRVAAKRGCPLPHPGVKRIGPYRLLDSIAAVPDEAWIDPRLVIERFVPELDDDGYALRTWVFMGARERCTRTVTPTWLGKAADTIRYEPVDVPEQLRAERKRLNFDFGKFDFVMSDGEAILLDANRTPGTARAIEPLVSAGARDLAEGLDALLRA